MNYSMRHTRRVTAASQVSSALGSAGERSNCLGAGGLAGQRSNGLGAGGSAGQRSNGDSAVDGDMNNSGNNVDGDSRGTKRAAAGSEQRGRHKRTRTALRNPPRGRKVILIPQGDMQFKYAEYTKSSYKYTTQLGCILKRQYPGVLKDADKNEYPALTWSDYYEKRDDKGESCADKVKSEFWRLFLVANDHRAEASRVLENYARKRVRNMMYQVRVDSVKLHFEKQEERILDDKLACREELLEEQYCGARIDWCKEDVWPLLARYWVSEEYLQKRAKAQDSRNKSEDVAQNRGGSRPFASCQQYLEEEFGPEKAGILNTYGFMKAGAKNSNPDGTSGFIPSRKAQKRLDDYYGEMVAANPDTEDTLEDTHDLDGKLLYATDNGLPHGRVPIGDGAVKKSDVLAGGKGRNIRPSNSESYRNLSQENEHLHRTNEALTEQQELDHQLIMMLFSELGKEPPVALLRRRQQLQAQAHCQVAGSSHGSEPVDGNEEGNGANGISVEHNGSAVAAGNQSANVGEDGAGNAREINDNEQDYDENAAYHNEDMQ